MKGDHFPDPDDRNQEAPFSSYEMGIIDYDIVPDINSPKFQRERVHSGASRTELETHHSQDDRRPRRRHYHHSEQPRRRTSPTLLTRSDPYILLPTDSPSSPSDDDKRDIRTLITTHKYFIPAVASIAVLLLLLILIHYYGLELDRLLSCPKTRYQAAAYKERSVMYYMCRFVKAVRNPRIPFIGH